MGVRCFTLLLAAILVVGPVVVISQDAEAAPAPPDPAEGSAPAPPDPAEAQAPAPPDASPPAPPPPVPPPPPPPLAPPLPPPVAKPLPAAKPPPAATKLEASRRLYQAAEDGHLAQVQQALKDGGDVRWVSRDDWTALGTAATHHRGQYEEVIRALLEARSDPDYTDSRGRTPLFFAAHFGLTNPVRMMLQAGAKKIHTSDGHGVSALNHATRSNHVEVVKELLAARADPHQADGFGGSAHAEASFMKEAHHAEIRRLHGHEPVTKGAKGGEL
mmetsp:Transcript_22902/g.64322  ORF Transcript_22902/g.64322 Transcript_22902/m.64322 type:complete len:273 (+) Transcript_22902:84-902(+)